MANRERTRSRSTSDASPASSQQEAFQVGETTLDLDDISEEDLESLYFEDAVEEESSFLNLQSLSGLSLILAGVIYLLSELGVWATPMLLGIGEALPWLIGVLVILLGFGVMSWRSSDDKQTETRKTKAVDAETGEPKVVEEPKKAKKNRLERSRTNKKLMGVCGGLAEYLNLDATLVRIAFVIGTIATSGPPFIIAYFGLAFAMPKEEPLSPEEKLSIIRNEKQDD
jgi:phage shock protein C